MKNKIKQYKCDDKGIVLGEKIAEYSSVSKASQKTGIVDTSISKNIRGLQIKVIDKEGNYFRFYDDTRNNVLNDGYRVERFTVIEENTVNGKIRTRYDNPDLIKKTLTKNDIEEYIVKILKLSESKGKFENISLLDQNNSSKMLLLVDSDRHIGSSKQDSHRFQRYVKWCLKLVKNGNYEHIVYVKLGDFYHTDNPFGMTTRGTQVGSPSIEESLIAIDEIVPIEIKFYEELSKLCKTTIINTRGNHDLRTSDLIHRTLSYRFENNKNISFDMSINEFKEIKWGKYLHLFSHGDNIANRQGDIIAHYNKRLNNKDGRVFLHTGHKHHFLTKDIGAGTWFQHPTSAPKNDFENRFGYLDDNRFNVAMEINKENGETNRYIHFIGKD